MLHILARISRHGKASTHSLAEASVLENGLGLGVWWQASSSSNGAFHCLTTAINNGQSQYLNLLVKRGIVSEHVAPSGEATDEDAREEDVLRILDGNTSPEVLASSPGSLQDPNDPVFKNAVDSYKEMIQRFDRQDKNAKKHTSMVS